MLRTVLRRRKIAEKCSTPQEPDRLPHCHSPLLHPVGLDHELLCRQVIDIVRPYTMVSRMGLALAYDMAYYLCQNQIAGAFVETGVWRGGCIATMAYAARHAGDRGRKFFIYDSFEGLPQPTEIDFSIVVEQEWYIPKEECKGQLVPVASRALSAPMADVESLFFDILRYPKELVSIHKGWFQDTIPKTKDQVGPIAFLRFDGDLYENTLCVLEHLFPLVVPGGILYIDDYGLKGCRSAVDQYLASHGWAPYLSYVDGMARYFVKDSSMV